MSPVVCKSWLTGVLPKEMITYPPALTELFPPEPDLTLHKFQIRIPVFLSWTATYPTPFAKVENHRSLFQPGGNSGNSVRHASVFYWAILETYEIKRRYSLPIVPSWMISSNGIAQLSSLFHQLFSPTLSSFRKLYLLEVGEAPVHESLDIAVVQKT